MSQLTHLDASGTARMVDVGAKPETRREAVATASVSMQPETLRLLREGAHAKGDVLTVARIAGIQGASRDGSPDRRLGGSPHNLRHVQSRGPRHVDPEPGAAGETRRQLGELGAVAG